MTQQITAASKRLEPVFSRPQDLPEHWYEMWDGLVTDMRREAQALPMNTMMSLLVERTATMYVKIRLMEAGGGHGEEVNTAQKLWLQYMSEFSRQLRLLDQTPEQRFISGVKAAITAALRKVGPDATVKDLLPVLTHELREYDV